MSPARYYLEEQWITSMLEEFTPREVQEALELERSMNQEDENEQIY